MFNLKYKKKQRNKFKLVCHWFVKTSYEACTVWWFYHEVKLPHENDVQFVSQLIFLCKFKYVQDSPINFMQALLHIRWMRSIKMS